MDKFIPLADVESVLAILARISLFGGTTDDQLKSILCRLHAGIVKQGEYVFRTGEEPQYIYILKRGRLDLLLCEGHVSLGVHELGVGECFGEASIISMHRHTASAVAKEESEVLVLSRRALIELRHEDIQLFALLMMNIARDLARRLYSTDEMLLHYLKNNGGGASAPAV
ncbi:MAG TPA: cyclic nucleotide-binding domain-containing protein [Chthoniobacteraceae bacterium]|jgi:CRP-like cAMP-binding protein|nr:cyclic nucleotide-binding domain-containing protein [Chthoniobacteraceae bacterium]